MNEIPENQLDIFEVLEAISVEDEKPKWKPAEKYLEEHHFDAEKTNPNFVYFLQANNKKVGDPYSHYEAQQWIDEQVAAFKQANNCSDHDMLNKIDEWPRKLREHLKRIAKPNG